MEKKHKHPSTSFRFEPETKRILEALAKATGLSMAGVVALALRDLAKKRGIK